MAEEIVEAARYAPLGNRGTFEPGPQNDYQDDPQDLPALDEQIHISVMLESKQAFRNIEAIAAVPGIDTLARRWFYTLSRSLSRTGPTPG